MKLHVIFPVENDHPAELHSLADSLRSVADQLDRMSRERYKPSELMDMGDVGHDVGKFVIVPDWVNPNKGG